MHLKVSELAPRYRFSVDAIYNWIRTGLIPAGCMVRAGNSIRIDADEFDNLLRAGKLYRPRVRRAELTAKNAHSIAAGLGFSEDQHTTRRKHSSHEHRFIRDDGAVSEFHPFAPDMRK